MTHRSTHLYSDHDRDRALERLIVLTDGGDGSLVWLTVLLLFCVTFVPFPTAVIGSNLGDPIAGAFYFGSLTVTALIFWATWSYPTRVHRLVPAQLDARLVRHYHIITLGATLVFLLNAVTSSLGSDPLVYSSIVGGYTLAMTYVVLSIQDWREPR